MHHADEPRSSRRGLASRAQRRGRRRTRCSTRSASAPARSTRPASSSSSRPRTRTNDRRSGCCRRCRSSSRWAAARACRAWASSTSAMLVHGEQGVTVHGPIPPDGEVESVGADRRHLRQGQGGGRAARDTSRRTSTAASPRSHPLRRVHPRRGRLRRESRGDEIADPPKMPDRSRRPRGHVRDARRPGAALPALAATATRCTPIPTIAKFAGFDRRRSCTACAPTASPAARCCTSCAAPTSRSSRAMDARFSKPVMPGDTLTVRMWDDGTGRAIFQTVTQDGTVVIDGGRFQLDVTTKLT